MPLKSPRRFDKGSARLVAMASLGFNRFLHSGPRGLPNLLGVRNVPILFLRGVRCL